ARTTIPSVAVPAAAASAPAAPVAPAAPTAPAAPPIAERVTSPSMVIQQAAHAASMLAKAAERGAITIETTIPTKATLATSGPMQVPSDLVRLLQVPLAQPISPQIAILHAPDSAMAASFRVLRHRLTHPGGRKITMVTSPRQGEGKTTCAVNLALAL